MKKCSKCGELKDFSRFYRRKDSPSGLRNQCKNCHRDYIKKWKKEGPNKIEYQDSDDKKQCRRCMKILDVDNFGRCKNTKDGLKSRCKYCRRKESAEWHTKNKDRCKKYRENNKESIKNGSKKYREKNKARLTIKQKEYVEKNKEACAKRKKNWYERNKERILSEKRQRYKENRDEIIAREQRYIKNSITAQIRKKLRTRFYQAVKKGYRAGSAVADLGCSIKELKLYLEKKFEIGMTWDNYGRWHIDHIIPLSSFDLTNREHVKKVCNYTNLQPLWAEDNLKKWAKCPREGDKK
jgi:hypothetical protein